MSGELTPEAAARGDIPERFARVLDAGWREDPKGRIALVAVWTREE